jgi:hypothetical protein
MKTSNHGQSRRALIVVQILIGAAVAIGGIGCQKPAPHAELAAAKTALEGAKAAGAEKYAAALYSKADASLKAAEKEIAAQKAKWALFRSYDQARELIVRATAEAKAASAEANNSNVRVTGLLVRKDGTPVAGWLISLVELTETRGKLVPSVRFVDGAFDNPSAETGVDGRFILRLDPSANSYFLDPDKQYGVTASRPGFLTIPGADSILHVVRFRDERGQPIELGQQIDIGRIARAGD